MLALLTRKRRPAPPPRRWFRPTLEGLETRECLSTLTLSWHLVSQNNVSFDGQYSGAATVANQPVTLDGPGWETTATTDSGGNYHTVVAMPRLGTVTASVQDVNCSPALVNVNPPPPTINTFVLIDLGNGQFELKGTITGTPNPQGMTLTITGSPIPNGSMTTTVGSNGQFDCIVTSTGLNGPVTAVTTDWWGQTSNTARAMYGA
jgi:hypothetical protein